jgi:3',5'-nucleoside bisphosphate phosphatase
MKANLHLHSRFSDGSLWPAEMAARAAALGLELAAVTDHDSLGGVEEFLAAAARLGMGAVAGCEIDCGSPRLGYRSELLAYFPQGGWSATDAYLRGLSRLRAERVFAYLESARRLFRREDLSFDDLLARKYGERAFALRSDGASLSKVDFYLYLVARGVLDSSLDYREFRKGYLDSGRIDGPRSPRATVEEVAETVRKDGGILVLPHVGHEFGDSLATILKERKRFRKLLEYFASVGVAGFELYWYRNEDTAGINAEVAREARRLGLFVTYGSDCHGPGSGKHTIRDFWGDFVGFPRAAGPSGHSRPKKAKE